MKPAGIQHCRCNKKEYFSFRSQRPDYYMILSGDQLYRMDLRQFLREHRESDADISIASTPVTRRDASPAGYPLYRR